MMLLIYYYINRHENKEIYSKESKPQHFIIGMKIRRRIGATIVVKYVLVSYEK